MVSNAIPYPRRTTLWLPLAKMRWKNPDLKSGLHARPNRGPIAQLKSPSYKCLAAAKLTTPAAPTTGDAGNLVPVIGVLATNTAAPGQAPVLNAGRVLPEKPIDGVTLTPPGCPR